MAATETQGGLRTVVRAAPRAAMVVLALLVITTSGSHNGGNLGALAGYLVLGGLLLFGRHRDWWVYVRTGRRPTRPPTSKQTGTTLPSEFAEPGHLAVELVEVGEKEVYVLHQIGRITGWPVALARQAVADVAGPEPVILSTGLSRRSAQEACDALIAVGADARVVTPE